jgi:hypothetical protein
MPSFDVYAIKLTNENIPAIVAAAQPLGWNLDHLQDSMSANFDVLYFDTMLYMKLWHGTIEIATFSDEALDPNFEPRLTSTIDPLFGLLYKLETI